MENKNDFTQTNETQFTNPTPQPDFQQPNQQPFYQPPVNDKKSVGLNIISFFIPLVGLIIYLVQKDTTPVKAKSAGKSALIGFILGIVLSIVYAVVFASLFGKAMDEIENDPDFSYGDYSDYDLDALYDELYN
ncbi:MAG: DUF456 domain-containing protein [Eubacterium sp.]|nr:DUF456 domain-containing protein [Eubacterium sp.]